MNLLQISDEYKENIDKLENRINELYKLLEKTHGHEARRKIMIRINVLKRLISESYEIAFYLENYYE